MVVCSGVGRTQAMDFQTLGGARRWPRVVWMAKGPEVVGTLPCRRSASQSCQDGLETAGSHFDSQRPDGGMRTAV